MNDTSVMLSSVNCNGNESNTLGCSHELIQNGCMSNSTAGVLCGGTIYDYYNAVCHFLSFP